MKQGTYSTYENGRTELPIEILVRLSYLYNIPIDAIVQRDRLYRTQQYKNRLIEIEKKVSVNEINNPMLVAMSELNQKKWTIDKSPLM